MSQNGQTYFKNPAALAARFLKCVGLFWDVYIKGLSFLEKSKWRIDVYFVNF